jgi:hypothetical protein
MLKRYPFWLWTAVVFLFLTALIHSLSFFIQPAPQNETERQLLDLLANYKSDLGGGFKRSTKDLFTALSACFSLVCLLGGLTIAYLAHEKTELRILKGVVGINVLIFGICFGLMAVFTFLPPIVLTGLIFLCLLTTYLLMPKASTASEY